MLPETETKTSPIANPIPLLYALAIVPHEMRHGPNAYHIAWYYGLGDIREEKTNRRRWRNLFNQHQDLHTVTVNGVYYFQVPANPWPQTCTVSPEAFEKLAVEAKETARLAREKRNQQQQAAYAAGTLKPL